jgi:hypothetical protein
MGAEQLTGAVSQGCVVAALFPQILVPFLGRKPQRRDE